MAIRVKVGGEVLDLPESSIASAQLGSDAKIEVYKGGQRGYVPFSIENYQRIADEEKRGGEFRFSRLAQAQAAEKQARLESETVGAAMQGLPGAELAMKAAGVPGKRLGEVAEANPWAYGGSKLASSIAVSLLPGGIIGKTLEGAGTAKNVANALLSGVKVLGIQDRLGGAAGNAAYEGIASLGMKAAKTAAGVVGGVTGAYTMAVGDAITDSLVYDTKFQDELNDGLSLRLALGGALPGAMGVLKDVKLGKLAKAAQKQADEADRVAKTASGINNIYESSRPVAAAGEASMLSGASSRAKDTYYVGSEMSHAKAAANMVGDLEMLETISRQAEKALTNAVKSEFVHRAARTDWSLDFGSFNNAVYGIVNKMSAYADSNEFGKRLSGMLRKASRNLSRGAGNWKTDPEGFSTFTRSFERLNRIKQKLDAEIKLGKLDPAEEGAAREVADSIRSMLVNPEIVGDGAARVQGINEFYSQWKDYSRVADKNASIYRAAPRADGYGRGRVPDVTKIEAVLSKAGGSGAKNAQDNLDHLVKMDSLIKEAAARGMVPQDSAMYSDMITTRAYNTFKSAGTILSPEEAYSRAMSGGERVSKGLYAKTAAPSGEAAAPESGNWLYDMAMGGMGYMAGDLTGAVVVGAAAGRMLKPSLRIGKTLAKNAAERVAQAQASQAGRNIAAFFKGINPDLAFQVTSFGPEKDDRDLEDIRGRVMNQDAMLDAYHRNDSEGALRMLEKAQTVAAMMPAEQKTEMLDEILDRIPSSNQFDQKRFKDDMLRLVEFPGFITYLTLTGRLNEVHVKTLEAVHPEALTKVREKFMAYAQALGKDLTEKQKQQLGVLFGKDISRTTSRKVANAYKLAYATLEQPRPVTALPAKMMKPLQEQSQGMRTGVETIQLNTTR